MKNKQTQRETLIALYRAALAAEFACRTGEGGASLYHIARNLGDAAYTALGECVGREAAGAIHSALCADIGYAMD